MKERTQRLGRNTLGYRMRVLTRLSKPERIEQIKADYERRRQREASFRADSGLGDVFNDDEYGDWHRGACFAIYDEETPLLYLDYNASTPCAAEVVDAMLPYFGDDYANPSSTHGRWLQSNRESSRRRAVKLLRAYGADPGEIVFTSGATESNCMIIHGVAAYASTAPSHIDRGWRAQVGTWPMCVS
jgi:hypothetical protein